MGLEHHAFFLFPAVFFFVIAKLLWFIVLALLIAALIRWLTRAGRPRHWGGYRAGAPFGPPAGPQGPHFGEPGQQPSAMEILRRRFARGEIDAATFDQMRERLEASDRPAQ